MYARYIPPQRSRPQVSLAPTENRSSLKPHELPKPTRIVFNDDDAPATGPLPSKKRRWDDDFEAPDPRGKRQRSHHALGAPETSKTGKDKKMKKNRKDNKDAPRDSNRAEGAVGEQEDAAPVTQPTFGPEIVIPEDTDKVRKTKKEKSKKGRSEGEVMSANQASQSKVDEDGDGDGDGDEDVKAERKKKKKEKKKGKERKATEQAAATEDAAMAKRHKSVLEKFEKSVKAGQARAKAPPRGDGQRRGEGGDAKDKAGDGEEEATEMHGLEPLPQPAPAPAPAPTADVNLAYETLSPWLASPVRVPADTRAAFTDLGIAPASAKMLASRGFADAFAVQTAALPLLLPSASPDRQGDLVIAAATGSGKTLAYVLPMVHDISGGVITRLRALIVLPTRDLVQQVQQACEACVAAFAVGGRKRVKVGTAMGNRAFAVEQAAIMAKEQKYDPDGYRSNLERRYQQLGQIRLGSAFADGSDDDYDDYDDDGNRGDSLLAGFSSASEEALPDHVITHMSKIDILICTPGRLVEHMRSTPGFTLDYVRWLVVDEADKLLAQDFQQWLDTVLSRLEMPTPPGARDFPASNKSGVRKVILSATMTRDVSLLNSLRLRRPRLVVLEDTRAGELALPARLREYAVKVRDPGLKPLYLLDLLSSEHMVPASTSAAGQTAEADDPDTGAECESKSESESEPESDSGSGSAGPDSDGSDDGSNRSSNSNMASLRASTTTTTTTTTTPRPRASVLVFTRSNEAALRLARLLAILSPDDLAPQMGMLASSARTATRARTLRDFARGRLRVLIASDLVARGIDLGGGGSGGDDDGKQQHTLDHVVNYDLPPSETAYVHRVGRTARAGRAGCAWTLVEHAEARRFWRDFVGEGAGASTSIARGEGAGVERARIGGGRVAVGESGENGGFSEQRIRAYEEALEQLKREAGEGRR